MPYFPLVESEHGQILLQQAAHESEERRQVRGDERRGEEKRGEERRLEEVPTSRGQCYEALRASLSSTQLLSYNARHLRLPRYLSDFCKGIASHQQLLPHPSPLLRTLSNSFLILYFHSASPHP
jgi:hypothetical protein